MMKFDPPHKVILPDGRTCYYSGDLSIAPLLVVEPDGSHYSGWGVDLDDPQVQAVISQADKRACYPIIRA